HPSAESRLTPALPVRSPPPEPCGPQPASLYWCPRQPLQHLAAAHPSTPGGDMQSIIARSAALVGHPRSSMYVMALLSTVPSRQPTERAPAPPPAVGETA